MEANTADSIMTALEAMSRSREPIDPNKWVEGAMKLTVLMGDEASQLYDMEQRVAQMRVEYLTGGMTATAAKMHVEASDQYKEARNQKAKIGRIEETVRLAKLRGRMASEEMRAQ